MRVCIILLHYYLLHTFTIFHFHSFHSQELFREMRSRDSSWVAESDAAASEATKGALSGAAKVLSHSHQLPFSSQLQYTVPGMGPRGLPSRLFGADH